MKLRVSATSVVFDCDGVLADSEGAWLEAEAEFCSRWGIDRSDCLSTHGLSMRETVRILLGERAAGQEAEAEAELVRIAVEIVPAHVRPLAQATQAVNIAAGRVPVVVASNSPRAVLTPVLEAIAGSVAGDEVAVGKPDPSIYRAALTLTGEHGACALAFEDSEAGVRSASAAGIRVVQVCVPGVPPFAQAADRVEGLGEFVRDPDRFLVWDS